MEIRIENGVTIILSGEKGKQPKYGYCGISYNPKTQTYKVSHTYKRRRYTLGYSTDKEELIARKKEAEKHASCGDFLEWYSKLKA